LALGNNFLRKLRTMPNFENYAVKTFPRPRCNHQWRSIANKFVKRVQYSAYLPGACPSSGTFSSDKTGTDFYGVGRSDNFWSLDTSMLDFA